MIYTHPALIQAGGYKLPFFVVGGLCFFLVIPTSLILKSSRKWTEKNYSWYYNHYKNYSYVGHIPCVYCMTLISVGDNIKFFTLHGQKLMLAQKNSKFVRT